MSNVPATRADGNALASAMDSDYDPFADDKEEVGGFQGQFLNFSGKTGEYTYGEDGDDEIEAGTTALLNINGVARGWICWDDGEVVDEQVVRWLEGMPPAKRDLEDHGPFESDEDGWKNQIIVPMYIKDVDENFLLKVASQSGYKNLVRFFQKDYGKVWKKKIGKDGLPQVPEVSLDSDFFKSKVKKVGKVYFPVFEIVGWHDYSDVADMLTGVDEEGDDPEDYENEEEEAPKKATRARRSSKKDDEDEKPKRTRRSSKKAEPEDEDEDGENPEDYEEEEEKPKTRRGRRSTKKDEPEEEEEAEDVDEDEDEKPRRRRANKSARVAHAEPQDEDEDEEAPKRRPRRGRNL